LVWLVGWSVSQPPTNQVPTNSQLNPMRQVLVPMNPGLGLVGLGWLVGWWVNWLVNWFGRLVIGWSIGLGWSIAPPNHNQTTRDKPPTNQFPTNSQPNPMRQVLVPMYPGLGLVGLGWLVAWWVNSLVNWFGRLVIGWSIGLGWSIAPPNHNQTTRDKPPTNQVPTNSQLNPMRQVLVPMYPGLGLVGLGWLVAWWVN
jgi:hypothetical protein